MLASQIPTKFPIPFGNNAAAGTIRSVPQASQTATSPGQASLYDGFPVATGQPLAAGGVPPSMQDFNGLFNQITAWSRWQGAGGTVTYDAAFSALIGGYPAGALVLSATTPGVLWVSTADNNTTNPDGSSPQGWTRIARYSEIPSATSIVSSVLPYTVAGATASKVFSPGQFQSDISTVGSYVVVQTLFMSNISYIDSRASVAFRNDTASVVNVTAQLQLFDTSTGTYVGIGQYLGEVIYNSFQVPITVNGQFQGLAKSHTYRLELAVQKQQAIQTAVLDGSITALHD